MRFYNTALFLSSGQKVDASSAQTLSKQAAGFPETRSTSQLRGAHDRATLHAQPEDASSAGKHYDDAMRKHNDEKLDAQEKAILDAEQNDRKLLVLCYYP